MLGLEDLLEQRPHLLRVIGRQRALQPADEQLELGEVEPTLPRHLDLGVRGGDGQASRPRPPARGA